MGKSVQVTVKPWPSNTLVGLTNIFEIYIEKFEIYRTRLQFIVRYLELEADCVMCSSKMVCLFMMMIVFGVTCIVPVIGVQSSAVPLSNGTMNNNPLAGINPALFQALQSFISQYPGMERNIGDLLSVSANAIDYLESNLNEKSTLTDILSGLSDGFYNASLVQFLPDLLTSLISSNNPTIGSLTKIFNMQNFTGIGSMLGEILPFIGIPVVRDGSGGRPGALASFLESAALRGLQSINVSESCVNDTVRVVLAVMELELWALKFIDAMGKPLAGIMEGGVQWFGSFHQCLNIKSNQQGVNEKTIGGNYCLLNVPIPASLLIQMFGAVGDVNGVFAGVLGKAAIIKYGLCVPRSCGTDDVSKLNLGLMQILPYGQDLPTIKPICHREDNVWEDKRATIVIGVLFGIGLLIFMGTLYDIANELYGSYKKSVHKNGCDEKGKENSSNEFIAKPTFRNGTNQNGEIKSNDAPERIPSKSVVDVYVVNSSSLEDSDEADVAQPEVTTNGLSHNKALTFRGKPVAVIQGIVDGLLRAFSLYTNTKKLLNTDTKSGNLSSVNGIRFLSMSWVLLGHTYFFALGTESNLLGFGPEFQSRWTAQAILNALMSVDSFFTLSGLLVAYLTLKEMEKQKSAKINWLMFYFHRFWRLTPTYMLILMTYVPLFHYWGSGPQWPDGQVEPEICNTNWWRNLIYINNFELEKGFPDRWANCAWYVFPGKFYFTGIITSSYDMKVSNPGPDYMEKYYVKPWCRIGPYLVGLLVGYILYKTKCKVNLHISTVILGWCAAAVCCLATLYGLYGDSNGHPLSVGVSAVYYALHRTAWGAGLGWVIFACCTGYGGVVNTFLSWKLFIPLSRLTYCIYLIHPIVMFYFNLSSRIPLYLSDVNISYLFVGDLVFCYAIGFVVSLAFEAPILGLEKVIFRRK